MKWDVMIKHRTIFIESIFKIGWVVGLIYSLYMYSWMIFLSFLTQDLISENTKDLTWVNFILPNFLSIALLLLYTKELLMGYKPLNRKKNKISLTAIVLIGIAIIVSQHEFYFWIIESSEKELWLLIPVILILVSIIGLTINRIFKLIEVKSTF